MEVKLVSFDNLNKYKEVSHCFTSRHGGYSNGVFSSLNMGFGRGDDDDLVMKNYELVAKTIGFRRSDLVLSNQIHGDTIIRVEKSDRGKGLTKVSDLLGVDGYLTKERGVGLTLFFADCVPLYFYDLVRHAVAIAHAGWKGTTLQIARKMIERMGLEFGTRPEDIIAAIGPSICGNCYEVSEDVKKQFDLSFNDDIIAKVVKTGGIEGKYIIDLKLTNRLLMEESGIKPVNIEVSQYCTLCHHDLFFSHRKMGNERGSQVGIIGLR